MAANRVRLSNIPDEVDGNTLAEFTAVPLESCLIRRERAEPDVILFLPSLGEACAAVKRTAFRRLKGAIITAQLLRPREQGTVVRMASVSANEAHHRGLFDLASSAGDVLEMWFAARRGTSSTVQAFVRYHSVQQAEMAALVLSNVTLHGRPLLVSHLQDRAPTAAPMALGAMGGGRNLGQYASPSDMNGSASFSGASAHHDKPASGSNHGPLAAADAAGQDVGQSQKFMQREEDAPVDRGPPTMATHVPRPAPSKAARGASGGAAQTPQAARDVPAQIVLPPVQKPKWRLRPAKPPPVCVAAGVQSGASFSDRGEQAIQTVCQAAEAGSQAGRGLHSSRDVSAQAAPPVSIAASQTRMARTVATETQTTPRQPRHASVQHSPLQRGIGTQTDLATATGTSPLAACATAVHEATWLSPLTACGGQEHAFVDAPATVTTCSLCKTSSELALQCARCCSVCCVDCFSRLNHISGLLRSMYTLVLSTSGGHQTSSGATARGIPDRRDHAGQAAPLPQGSTAAPPQGSTAAPPQGSTAAPPQGTSEAPPQAGLARTPPATLQGVGLTPSTSADSSLHAAPAHAATDAGHKGGPKADRASKRAKCQPSSSGDAIIVLDSSDDESDLMDQPQRDTVTTGRKENATHAPPKRASEQPSTAQPAKRPKPTAQAEPRSVVPPATAAREPRPTAAAAAAAAAEPPFRNPAPATQPAVTQQPPADASTHVLPMYFEGHSSVVECMVVCKPWQPLDRHRLLLATGSHDRRCCIFDLESGEKIRTLEDHTGAVTCIAVSSDGRRLFTGSADGTVRSYDLKDASPLRTFNVDAPVSSMLWLQGALLVGTGLGTVLVFHQDVAVPAQILPGHTLGVVGLAQRSLGAGRHLLVTASTDKTVRAQILLLSVDKGRSYGVPSECNERKADASPSASAARAPGPSPAHDWDGHCSQCMCCLEPMAVSLDVDALQADGARLGERAAFAQELCAGCRSLLCLFQTTTVDERVKQCKHRTCLLKCPACRQTRLRGLAKLWELRGNGRPQPCCALSCSNVAQPHALYGLCGDCFTLLVSSAEHLDVAEGNRRQMLWDSLSSTPRPAVDDGWEVVRLPSPVLSIALVEEGVYVGSAVTANSLQCCSLGKEARATALPETPARPVRALLSAGRYLYAGSFDGVIYCYKRSNLQLMWRLQPDDATNWVYSLGLVRVAGITRILRGGKSGTVVSVPPPLEGEAPTIRVEHRRGEPATGKAPPTKQQTGKASNVRRRSSSKSKGASKLPPTPPRRPPPFMPAADDPLRHICMQNVRDYQNLILHGAASQASSSDGRVGCDIPGCHLRFENDAALSQHVKEESHTRQLAQLDGPSSSVELQPYEILQLSRSASGVQLKARWRELSRRWHPDRNPANPNAGRFFQMFSAAYQQLA